MTLWKAFAYACVFWAVVAGLMSPLTMGLILVLSGCHRTLELTTVGFFVLMSTTYAIYCKKKVSGWGLAGDLFPFIR